MLNIKQIRQLLLNMGNNNNEQDNQRGGARGNREGRRQREEIESDSEEEIERPRIAFGANQHNRQPIEDYRMKGDIPYFNGHLSIEGFLDWLVEVERFFEIMSIPEERMTKIAAFRLKGSAAVWWDNLQKSRQRQAKQPVRTWRRMRQLMMDRFLPVDYEQHLYRLYHNCVQGGRTVEDYTDEFLRLAERNSLSETQGQTVSRYVNGLTTSIQDRIGLQVFWDVHEAQNMAMKAQHLEEGLKERELKEKKTNYGNNNTYPRKAADPFVPNREKKEFQPMQRNNYKGQNYRGESSQNNDSNQNRNQRPNHGPYARATGDVCYRCFQPGHRSNNCPKRKQANLVEGINEADDHSGDYDEDYDGAEFAYEDNNEVVNQLLRVNVRIPLLIFLLRHIVIRVVCGDMERVGEFTQWDSLLFGRWQRVVSLWIPFPG
uniref:CCHC-type domain-containing protein n=1 Tax=Salix viminalis TaxID=40686 RepID=A0A6N2L5E8_SALVM